MDGRGPSTGLALWARARYFVVWKFQEGVWERLVSIFLTSKGALR
jgi:hypothetical protein